MAAKLFIVLLLVLCGILAVKSQFTFPPTQSFSCSADVPGTPLNLEALAGYWYEVARVPNADVMDCLNVSVPATASDNLELNLAYISKINGNRRAVKENVVFPWDTNTQNSTFILNYSGGESLDITVTYKVVYTDYKVMTALCGFAGVSPVPLFKILSRERELNPKIKELIQKEADKSQYGKYLFWTEQSPDRCNAAVRPAAGAITILTLAILWSMFKW